MSLVEETQNLPIDGQIVARALKAGIMLKNDATGFWEPFVGIISLTYVQQFDEFVIIYSGRNPQDAKMVFLKDFKKTWDIK